MTKTNNSTSPSKVNAKVSVTKAKSPRISITEKFDIKAAPVSPTEGRSSRLEDEIIALRARNKVLTETLDTIKEKATIEMKKTFDLVWYAKNRCRFMNHSESKRIQNDESHQKELEKLQSADADYYHGLHCGILAATRMFKQQADILHINEFKELNAEMMSEAAKHAGKIEASIEAFPHVTADTLPSTN